MSDEQRAATSASGGGGRGGRPKPDPPDLSEHGSRGAASDRRLFLRLVVIEGDVAAEAVERALRDAAVEGCVYLDAHHPGAVGVLTIHEDPAELAERVGPALGGLMSPTVRLRHAMTMLGRTYALGYEPDLEETLIERPRRTAHRDDCPWAVWYPLRRSGAFARLERDEQMAILREHGTIGMAFGQNDLAHDIRLASHGLDPNDSDFTVGLVAPELSTISKLVEKMRPTVQTSTYLERLGPFFVGRRVASVRRG
ncbi:MAG: chlorite dismutase family protein [Planctomycetota bacterium]